MKPLAFVIFQLLVIGWLVAGSARRNPSTVYRVLLAAAMLVVVGFDVWYLADHAYPPGGFTF